MNFLDLPTEILLQILCLLDPKDLFETAKVCRSLNQLSKDTEVWNHKFDQEFPVSIKQEISPPLYYQYLRQARIANNQISLYREVLTPPIHKILRNLAEERRHMERSIAQTVAAHIRTTTAIAQLEQRLNTLHLSPSLHHTDVESLIKANHTVQTHFHQAEYLIPGEKKMVHSVLQMAIKTKGYEDTACWMIEHAPRHPDELRCKSHDRTPLMWAAEHGNTPVAKALIHKKANVNAQDAEGETPLMVAAWYKKTHIVNLLLRHGADPDIVTEDNHTAEKAAEHSEDNTLITTISSALKKRKFDQM